MTQTKLDTREHPEWVLMAKALRGELSDQEQAEFNAWLNADDSHTLQWAEALEVWDEVGTEQNLTFTPNADLAWENLCTKIELTPQAKIIPLVPEAQAPVETKIFPWNTLYKYAAAFVLAAGLAWVGYIQLNTSSAWTQVATAAGERHLIYLPDSSQVTLNENSTLRYQTAFNGTERKVELTGEGFFEVRKNPEQPFIVESGETQTKVLGTSFNVKALAGEAEVSVAVVTGKVSFSTPKDKQEVILTPGFTGTLSKEGKLAKTQTTEDSSPMWQALVFKNASLAEVARQLEQYFNISVDVSDQKLQQCTFTGTFANPELKEVLSVLVASSDITISRSEAGSYTIGGAGCQ